MSSQITETRTLPSGRPVLRFVLQGIYGLCALALVACGGGESGSGSAGVAASGDAASRIVVQAKANVERDYKGTDRELPRSGPKAVGGKSIWVIPCTSSALGCAGPAAGAVEAAKKIGWKVKLVDGKGDPAVWNQAIRNAIAARADAVMLVAFDCAAVKGSLEAAKSAGVKVVSVYGIDCNDPYGGGGKPLFDGALAYDGKTYGETAQYDSAHAQADYAIAKTNGKAKVIALREDDLAIVRHANTGFKEQIAKCSGCEIYEVPFTLQDLVTGKLQAKLTAALGKYPQANVVHAPYDATILLGAGAAVRQAHAQGRKIMLVGLEGLQPNMKLIKQGIQTAAAGVPARWAGWAGIDAANRIFAGRSGMVDPGIGHQTIDKGHNLQANLATGYDGNPKSKGYDENYLRIWGIDK